MRKIIELNKKEINVVSGGEAATCSATAAPLCVQPEENYTQKGFGFGVKASVVVSIGTGLLYLTGASTMTVVAGCIAIPVASAALIGGTGALLGYGLDSFFPKQASK